MHWTEDEHYLRRRTGRKNNTQTEVLVNTGKDRRLDVNDTNASKSTDMSVCTQLGRRRSSLTNTDLNTHA
jgi:hypothetical protein